MSPLKSRIVFPIHIFVYDFVIIFNVQIHKTNLLTNIPCFTVESGKHLVSEKKNQLKRENDTQKKYVNDVHYSQI